MSKYEFDGEKVKKLYEAMQKLGYQQSLGEFEKGFYGKDNYQKRKAVYDVMTENGADLGSSYEDFIGRMRATGATKPTNKAPNTHISEQPWAQKNKEAKRAAAVLDGGFDALTRAVEVSSDEDFRNTFPNKLASERVEDPKSKRLITKPKKYRVPESDVREGGSMVRMVDAYKTVDGKAVSIHTTATSAQPSGNQDEDFATQYISGKINREEYKKKAKAKDNEAAIANSQPTMEGDEEFLYRTDKRYREYRDKILNGDGDVDELSPETKAWYLERVEARIKDAEERQKKYLSIINSDEHQKKLEENNTDFWRNFSQARGGVGAIGREQAKSMLRETDYTEDMGLANAGLGATESELTDLHALRDMLKGKDVGFFRRFKDFFGNRNNLTFGFQEAADNATLIANKNSKSPLLSSAAESKAKESEAATMYSRSANLRAKAGSVTAEMLPFVIEMASAGSMTSVAGKAAHKAVYSLGTRMLKSAALKGMEEGLLKATGTAALKVGTRGLSWIAHGLTAGALQTVTAGAGETAANITGRMVGHGAQQGDGSYAFEGGEGAVGAVLHGFTSQLIENATEFMGGGLGYGVGKVASKLTKPLAKVGLGGVTNFFGRIAASPISKATSKTLSKFQIQGIPEEIGEEYLGWAGHSMAGDGDAEWSDFADFQKHKELWATMALSVGAMGAFAASGHVPSLLKRRGRSLKMADRAAAGAFSDEEKWNALRDKLDGTDNNNVLRSLYDNVMQDKSLNGRERKAAMLYAGNLLAYRGANLGAIAGKRLALEQKRSNAEDARRAALVEGTASDDAERIDEHELDGDDVVSSAFRQGYEETSAANAYMWAKTLEEQEGHAMESLGLSEKELNEKFSPQNAGETLNEIRGAKEGTYTEEQKKSAFDYANTRAAYEGVVERTQDDIDSEIAYHHAIVDRQTNIDFGRLHPVKLFTSEKNKRDDAFLVSGRLAFEYNDKGESVVSTRLSDPTLVVSDAAGRTRMVSPLEIADAEDAIDVDEYKNTLAEHVRQEMEGRKYAEMLKAAEEAQANEVGEGEPEVPAIEEESTTEEGYETSDTSENGEQSNVFGGSFNVGDKFSTEDGEFEVVQLTEGEAPIVQNVETGQQFRPHSEGDLRAAVQSYTPAFIDGAENTNGVTTYSRVAQEETAPQNEAQEEDGTTSEDESVDKEQEGLTEDSDSSPSDSQSESTQEEPTSSLEEVQSALDKGEIVGVTPQMAHDALYNDPDLETEEVDAIVENSRSASQANLAKLQKTEIKPRKNESVIAFKKRKAAHAGALEHAEELVRFWEDVQEHRRNLGAQAMQEEENAKQQREAEAAERAKEQAENGLAVAPSWANAEKIVGRPGEFITPNGLRVKGHYVLVESGAAVPSHDARHGFKQSEGFPTDEKGHTLNDRDYERDLDAQRVQREIARNYDARATQQPVVVSPEGFVLSGNGRTMSGDLAAMENTDGAYNSYVREYPEMWGFTSDQVEKLEHPRVVFVSDSPLPLTTETFAAFNAQETKTQSRTEKAVKMGKAVSDEDFAKILRIVTDGHETLADFYGNMSGVSEVINLLETSGVITQQDRANLFDGDALSDEGRNLLENVLLGKAFEGNPDVVRQLSEVRSLRTSVLNALFYIVENERLNEEFRLGDELSRAINFVYHARKGGGYSFGDKVRTFAQQTELFESTTDVTLDDATVLLLADALNDKRTTLIKSIFKSYNERAEDAGRGQMSLFGDALPSRETLIMETLALLGVDIKDYAPSNQVESSNQETNEQQQDPKQQQQPEAGTSEPSIESTSEQGAEGKAETELSSGSVSTSGRGNEGVSTEKEGAKPSDKNAKPSEKSTEKGKANKGKKKQTSPSSQKPTRVLVSEEQHLKNQARLKELLRGTTLNVGINPEILALGIQEAAYYLEGGIRTFVDFASKMVEAFGDDVRPYVKAFYNGARDMPELAELGIDKEMTPYDEVREFDVGNFDRETNVEDESKGTTESNVVLNDESPKEKEKNNQEETTAETNSENKENEEQSDLFSQSNLGEEKQEPKSSSLEVGQKVKYRTSSGKLLSAEVKALNRDGSVHLLVEVPNGAIPTMNVANASMSDIVIDEPTPQKKKEKQPPKTNKKNGQRNKSTHGSVGTETREDTRPAERGGVDRSDSGDNVPDGSGSTRVSSVPRENGQRSTTDVKPESSDKETENDKKEGKKESKNLNSRSFHQIVAEAESLADENNTPAKRYRANIAAIKLIHQLEEEGRLENATPEEQKVLASYSSWGGLGVYFGSSAQSKVDELRELLTDEEFEDAVSSLSSGYFTPPHIVEGMWDVLRHLGFKGGRVFEGSAGVGGMLTLMPSDMLKNSSIRAVEKDSLTAKILKALHPDADVFSGGIEDVNAAPSSVDVAITNVPFVSGVRPVDKRNTDITRLNLDLHDFAIAKNVRLLAPGGIGIFMTTSLSLDKGQKLKEWLNTNGEADVLGAFRFNNETFAGAPVTTDVIVIRKRDKGVVSPHAVRVLDNHVERVVSYIDEKTREEKPLQVSYNNYFHEHSEFMGGRMFAGAEKGDTFRPSSIGLYPDPSIDQKSQWEKWVGTFESMDKPLESVVPSEEEDLEESSLPVGTLTVNSQGRLGVVDSFSKIRPIEDDGKKVKSKYTKAELLEDYNRVKEAVRAVLDYQLNNLEDDGLKPVLNKLNKAYDDFVNKYGVFHNNQAIRILKNDADYQGVAALERVKEHRNEKTRKIEAQVSKSDFFTQRTLGGLEELKASTIEDGLRLSMSKKNRIDSEFIAGLLNREVSDVEKELLDKELVYRNPTTGLLEDKASYLSGNVREKLSVAEAQNADGQYTKNINALTSVLPPTIPSHLISTPLGGTWFSPDYFRNFLAEVYGSRVVFYRVGSQWHMDGIVSPLHARGGVRSDLLRNKGTSRTKYHWTVEELTLAAMNNVAPKAQATISKTDYNMPSGKTTIKISDEEASRAIIVRMADLKDEFQGWMSKKMQEDPKAAAELEKSYNERFNSHVPYRADNSLIPDHFEGSNPAITLRSHQAAAAVRAVNSPTLLAHEVGTGKTFTMITAAAEMKRLGTANKPMIVVQNATLNQFASEAKKLYPAAKLLVYDANRDKGTDGRKAFYARIKYGDWDMIVVPQSVLDLIPDDPQQKDAYLNQAVDDMLALAEQTEDRNVKREIEKQIESLLRRQSASSSGNGKNNSQRSLKDQEVAKEKAEDKAERRMMRHTDEVAHFGEMGVDALIVDEAHEYKHLGFATTMTRVKGVDPTASKKAVSLYLKARHILENNGWKNVVFATGTPVSNTAAEVWTFMRYLIQPEILKQLQLYYFDDFVHNFGKIEQRLEFSTNGQFKEQTRFAGYQGLPELARVWASIADTVLAKDTDIKRPKRDNGQGEDADQDIFLEQTPSLVRIMKAVKAKLEEFEKMSGAEKKKNSHIPLTMFGLASAAAIDTRLVSSNAVDEPGSKTNAAVERTLESLEETKEERGTVAIFADKFRRFDTTEDGKRVVGFNLFEDIREKLIARGVPAEQIVVMQDGMTDKAKADIFAKVNAGEIRVIMGSTQRLGVGVNIQERLNLLIHMDAPARPMDYTQRNGRILRQGNLYEEWGKPVHVIRFGVKDSLDVSAYQRLQTKEGFIRPIMESQRTMDNAMTQRSVEEDEGEFDNPVAQLSGSQYALLLQKAKREVRKYEAYEAQWKQDQTFIPQQLRKNAGLAKNAQSALSSAEARLEMLRSIVPQGKVQDVALHLKDGSVAHNEDAIKLANSAINAIAKEIRAEQTSNERTLSLSFILDNVKVEIRASLMGIQKFDEKTKTISTSVSTSLQWSSEDLGVKDEPLLVHRLGDALNYITESVISGAEAEEQIERAKGQLERLEKENASLHERQGVSFKYADELKRARGLATDFEQKMHEELKEQEARYAERMNKNGDFVVDDLEVDEMIMSQIAEQEAEEQEEGKAREQRTANENALDGVSPEQIELRDGLVDIMRDAGMDVSVSDAEGQRVLDLARGAMTETDAVREERVLQQVNAQFNAELQSQKEGRLRKGHVYNLGLPSAFLRSAGVADLPMQLTAQRLATKADKDYKNDHPFDLTDVKNLPKALAAPIAVFDSGTVGGTKVVLTELEDRKGNNLVVILRLDKIKGKKALDVKVNSVRSIYPKDNVQGILKWINEDHLLVAVDEKKAINWIGKQRSNSADVTKTANSFDDAAKVIKGFKNPKLSGENLRQQLKNSITEEIQSIKTKAQSEGTFMLAPNGEPTNLTERQWLQVRTDSFKEWFGDWENDPENASKVVDANGEPRVVYHQTSEQFTKFDLAKSRSQSDVQGFFFSSGTEDWSAMGDEKMAVFLNLRNPVDKPIVDQSKNYAGVVARENLLKAGNDGAISFDEDESEEIEYLVLSPSQIKSATDNVGAFDKENDDIRFYRGQHGEVRGFAVGGRIYLDPKMASDETAIHEYTHLWADALRRVNPAEWGNVKDLLRGTPIWEETKRLYPELADDEDALADEVLAQFSGRHGANRLAEAREKAMSEADGVFDKTKVASVFDNVRQALKRFWKGVADFLGLHFTSAEEVADKVLSDLLNGVNPNGVIANTKDSIREQRVDNDTREEMQRSVDDLRVEVREGYEKAVKNWKYKIKEQWQDSMLALKTLQDELEKKGAKIEEWENAYWAENRMSSMNEEEMKAYTRDYFKPIVAAQIAASKALPQELTDKLNAMDAHLREFEKMDAEAKQRNAVDNYLMLKHGLERNRVLAMRDAIDAQWENPSEASSVWRAYNEDAGNRENRRLLQEGKRSFEEFLQVDDAIRAHYAGEEYLKNREKDYSGLTSMTTEELAELKDVENAALQLVKEVEDAAGAELSALWDKVNKATRASVEKLYKSGLLTPAAYFQMTTMFQWYVPLRGFAEETSDEVYDYVDQRNGNGMGAILRGADGRKSKADSPIAHIGSMAERSVVQGNRNLMKQHFYRMVMAHPNDLVSMGEIYLHHNEVTGEWEMMTPTHSPNATPEQIAEETRAFEERMQELVKQEPDNYLRLREHPDVPYRVLGSNLGEHQVLVKVLGRDKLLTVNGDPRVAQAVNGLFNPDAISNGFLKRLRNLNNFLAQMATQRNPEFIFRNLIRDRFYAMEAARVKDGAIDPQYVGRLQKNWISAVGQVVGLTARYNSGTLDMNYAQDRMFYEFMMNGGATGVTRLLNPEEYKGEITDIAKEMQRGEFHPAKVAKLVTKYVDLFGSVSESITRFATYRTSRELGRSVARSVWDAKEITTNFNKKGAGSKAIRKDDGRWLRMSGETASFFKNFVIFTNANVQGFHNQWQFAKNNPKRFIAHFVAKWVALGFAMPLINNLLAGLFGGDDDHYQDLPETARRNSLCLFVPKVGWVKIPLGFGLRSAYAVGGLLSEQLFYPKGDYTSMTRSLFDIALDLMPLSMGSSEQDWWLNVVPSSLRPLAENIANKDWTGRPIVNENVNEHWPEYRRANNRTSNISIKISEALNNMTGGDEYTPGFINLNPSQFEHIALGLLSGVGTLVGNTYETTANLAQGEKLDTQHIPFLKDFYSTSGGATHTSAVKRNFYALKDEYEKTKVRVLGYEREEADGKNDPESVARRVDFTKNSADYKRYEVMDEAVSEVNSLRNDLKEATTPEEVKALEAEMQQVMEDAINDVRAIK